jgi:thiamine-phosphate pyrophosphorylase
VDRVQPPASIPSAADAQVGVWRACDASANRAREALRVVEDYVRFVLDDRHLTECLKQLRHDLTAALAALPRHARLASRETLRDVGVSVTTPSEHQRADGASVLAANFARLSEALRSLEEFGKLLGGDLGVVCESLRYRAYTLERAVGITAASLERLAHARLYVLMEGGGSLDSLAQQVDELAAHGVDIIQLRDKRLADRELLERARVIAARVRDTQTLFIMNDRPDLAVLSGAAGVHVGQEELSVKEARAIVGPDALVGVSTHSLEQARQAVLDGADYLGLGPTFPSGTKQFAHFPGVEFVGAASREIRLPAFAIGGITADNLDQVLAAGGRRIAVSGAVTRAASPGAAAAELARRLARGG